MHVMVAVVGSSKSIFYILEDSRAILKFHCMNTSDKKNLEAFRVVWVSCFTEFVLLQKPS